MLDTVTCMSDYRRGFGLEIGFIDHLYTQLGTTLNYSAIANLHNLQITTAHVKSFPACCVFTSRSPVMASNSGNSAASAVKSSLNSGSLPIDSFLHSLPYRTDLLSPAVFLITAHVDNSFRSRTLIRCRGNVFTEPFSSSGRLFLLIKNLLPNNDVRGRCLETNVSEPFASNGCFSGSTVLALSK
jgi:hypothetical protein